jgi:hypothetical protein
MEEEYGLKYLSTGLFFAFALATTFLPLLLGIADYYSLHIVIELLGIAVITFINYCYISLLKDKTLRYFNIPILIPMNIILMFVYAMKDAPLRIEFNVAAFSSFILFIPWLILIIVTSIMHFRGLLKTN